jgi:protease-4
MNMNDSPFANGIKQLQKFAVDVINNQRQQTTGLDYIQIHLPEAMPALPDARSIIQQRLLGRNTMSLNELDQLFTQIAHDPRPKGVILIMTSLEMGNADLQTLRASIHRLREKGKRVIAYAQGYDLRTYYVASACDEILLQPGGTLNTQGLYTTQLYLKDGLAELGIQFDVLQISPYKSAGDTFARNEPSEEVNAMINWMLDSQYDTVVNHIAQDRDMSADDVRAMIDEAPYIDLKALDAGYVDGICNEEGFYSHLKTRNIIMLDKARKLLMLRTPKMGEKVVGVLHLSGMIVNGESNKPPVDIPLPLVGGERMGDATVVQQIRNLMHMPNLGALVVYVDSGGGSATASEAIASALDELAKRIPVVVYMHNVAASGGYYIATPADWIVAAPSTITGSIGVIFAKPNNAETYKKLKLNMVSYERGKNASLMRGAEPWTDDQRAKLLEQIERIYEQFMGRVADSRKMKIAEVDAIGGGRIWTGVQALENGLVDELGDLYAAVQKARELAQLGDESPAMLVGRKTKPLPAQLAEEVEQVNPAAALKYWQASLKHITNGQAQMLMPFTIDTK